MSPQSKQKKLVNGTEARIRETALRLFAEKGFEGTGIREIAAETRMAVSALYYYVGTKEELLLDIIRDCTETLLRSGLRVTAKENSPEMKLAQLAQLHVWLHGTHRLEVQVVLTEIRSLTDVARQDMLDLRDRYDAVWRNVVAQGTATRVFQVQDVKLASIALIEMCSAIAHWYRPHGSLRLEEICEMHADWALGLVRAMHDGTPVRAVDLELGDPRELCLQ